MYFLIYFIHIHFCYLPSLRGAWNGRLIISQLGCCNHLFHQLFLVRNLPGLAHGKDKLLLFLLICRLGCRINL